MERGDESVSDHLILLAVTGSVTYAVVFAVALLRDLWPRLLEKLPWRRRRGVVGMRRRMLRRKTGLMGLIYRMKMLYLESYREASWFFFAVEISTLLGSLVCCGLYTLGTYRRNVNLGLWVYNLVVGVFLILEWIVGFWTAELSLKFIVSRYTLLSAFSIPSLLLSRGERAYLHFGYLVGYTAYLAFRRLSSRTFFRGFNEKRSLFVETGLHFVTLVFVLACTIQLLEIPGDLLSQAFLDAWEDLDNWNFVNSVYYTVVTLSTVGYGDQSPKTLQGRIFAIFAIIVGIILFSNLISNLYEVAARDYGSRSYYKSRSTRHVIVGGSPQLGILRHFISEFYARRQNTYAKIVVLVENPTWTKEEWYGMLETHFLQSRIVYVRGSALNSHDLQRARITQADAIFLVSCPTECGNPAQQDIDTVMEGLSVRNLRSDIPVYAIAMLRKSSVQLNLAIRIPSSSAAEYRESSPAASQYRGLYSNVFLFEYMHLPENAFAEDSESMEQILEKYGCYYSREKPRESNDYQHRACEFGFSDLYRSESMCLQRLRTTLLAGNIQCNGLGTLMTNMILEVRPERDSMDAEWLQEYHMGAACDLHYAIIPEAFDKVVLRRVALLLYYHGLILVATQAPNDRYFTPVTATSSTVLYKDHIGMFLTYHRRRFASVALRAAGMTFRCDPDLYCGGNSEWARELEKKRVAFEKRVSDNPEEYRSPELHVQQMPPVDQDPDNDGYFGTPLYPTFTAEEGPDFNIFDSCLDLTILRRRGQNLGDVPPELERHIIVSADKACVLQDISLFLHTLWKRHGESQFTKRVKKKAVVIVSPVIPARLHQEWSQYLGRCLFLVNGSPSTFVAWEKARLKQAQAVISMTNHRSRAIDADARTIFTSLTLDMLTQPESDLFICSELLDESSLEYLREPSHPRRRGAYLGDAAYLRRIKTNQDRMRKMLSARVESSGEVTVPQPAVPLNPEKHEHIWGDPTTKPPAPPNLDLSAVAHATEGTLQGHASMKGPAPALDDKGKDAAPRRDDRNAVRNEYRSSDETGDEEDRSDGIAGKSDDSVMSDGNDRLVDKLAANFDRELKKQGAEAMEAAKSRNILSPPPAVDKGRTENGELREGLSNAAVRRSSEVGRKGVTGSSPSSSQRSAGSRRGVQEESTEFTLTDSEGADLDGKEQRRAVRIKRASLFSRPRYASGELVVYSSLYTLLAREYVEPGFVAFFSDIIGASDGEGAGRKVRLVRVPKFLFEKSRGRELLFRDVFDLIVQLGATPLGLYRSGQGPVRLPRREEDLRSRRGPLLYDKLDAMATCYAAARRRKSCASKARKMRKKGYSHYLAFTERVGFSVISSKKENGQDRYGDSDSESSSYHVHKRNRRASRERELGDSGTSTSESSGDRSASESEMVNQRGVHCFGDHKLEFKELTDCQNILPYVFTLPEPYTVLAEEDGIFILCDPRFELPDTWPSP